MSKLWEAIKDLERKRELRAAFGGDRPQEVSDDRERCVAYIEGIRWKWRRHAAADDEQ